LDTLIWKNHQYIENKGPKVGSLKDWLDASVLLSDDHKHLETSSTHHQLRAALANMQRCCEEHLSWAAGAAHTHQATARIHAVQFIEERAHRPNNLFCSLKFLIEELVIAHDMRPLGS